MSKKYKFKKGNIYIVKGKLPYLNSNNYWQEIIFAENFDLAIKEFNRIRPDHRDITVERKITEVYIKTI